MRPALPDYPWDQLRPFAETAKAHPNGIVDLSVGSPIDPTPEIVEDALRQSADAHTYPLTAGSDALRDAISHWYARRRDVHVSPEGVLPTIGSKELVALLPFLLGLGPGDTIVHPRVAYPTYAMSAALVGADAVAEDDPALWPEGTKLIWLNSPSNPTGQVLGFDVLAQAVRRARELGAVILNDECYAELGWQTPWSQDATPSILHADVVGESHRGVLSVYSLSKQSNLAGYRGAFLAGDTEILGELLKVRKHAGLMVPAPVQSAMIAALADDAHVLTQKSRYAHRRAQLLPALQSAGFRVDHSEAGLYLWVTRDEDCWLSLDWFARLGILGGPGIFYGDDATQHVRLSLTASDERIAEAAVRLTR